MSKDIPPNIKGKMPIIGQQKWMRNPIDKNKFELNNLRVLQNQIINDWCYKSYLEPFFNDHGFN